MTLDDKLTQWNGGELRGAAARLARETGAAPNLVSMWRDGVMPGDRYLKKIAKALSVTEESVVALIKASKIDASSGTMVREHETPYAYPPGYDFIDVPHLGTVSASRFAFSFDLPPDHFTTLGIKGKSGERYAVLRISGDCMAPRIEDGDEVLIRQISDVADGTIAIVCFDGECTMKRVYRKKDGFELRADNPKYKPVHYTSNKATIIAEVIKIMKDPGRKP